MIRHLLYAIIFAAIGLGIFAQVDELGRPIIYGWFGLHVIMTIAIAMFCFEIREAFIAIRDDYRQVDDEISRS